MSEPHPPGMEAVFVVLSEEPRDAQQQDPVDNLNWLLGTTDASAWAQQFCRVAREVEGFSPDEGWMIGWFANAMAAQLAYDHREQSAITVGQAVIDFGPDDVTTPESAVYQALGGASSCWENLGGAGLFDATRCKGIGDALIAYLRDHPLTPTHGDMTTDRRIDAILTEYVQGWPAGYSMDPIALVERIVADAESDRAKLHELQIKYGEMEPPLPPPDAEPQAT